MIRPMRLAATPSYRARMANTTSEMRATDTGLAQEAT
jgi:hypothetical protein